MKVDTKLDKFELLPFIYINVIIFYVVLNKEISEKFTSALINMHLLKSILHLQCNDALIQHS